MLTARSVIILIIVIAVLSIIGGIYELMKPPGSEGLGRDSFGVRAHGQRALVELLEELKFPIERGLVPPSALLDRPVSIVFLEPEDGMVRIEPGFLKQVGAWVERGGTVLIAPGFETPLKGMQRGRPGGDLSALEALGLKDVRLTKLTELLPAPTPEEAIAAAKANTPDDSIFARSTSRLERPVSLPVIVIGSEFTALSGTATKVALAKDDLRVIDPTAGLAPQSALRFRASDGKEYPFAALYTLGKGRVIVVSDPSLFSNVLLGKDDNAIITAHLLDFAARSGPHVPLKEGQAALVSQNGRVPLVFDEFYHGLTIRGNPAWLLTRFPYGLLAATLAFVTLLWAWRASIHLGPPLEEKVVSRRTIAEYVHAMASLFDRGNCHEFVLGQLRDGVLWKLRKRLRLGPKSENVEDITRALGRKNALAAEQLREAAGDVDRMFNKVTPNTEKVALQAAKKLSQCL